MQLGQPLDSKWILIGWVNTLVVSSSSSGDALALSHDKNVPYFIVKTKQEKLFRRKNFPSCLSVRIDISKR